MLTFTYTYIPIYFTYVYTMRDTGSSRGYPRSQYGGRQTGQGTRGQERSTGQNSGLECSTVYLCICI